MSTIFGTPAISAMLSALIVFAVWSWIYKVTIVYHVIEHLILGISTAHFLIIQINLIRSDLIYPLQKDFAANSWLLLVLIAGLLCYSYFTRYRNIYRYAMVLLIAVNLGSQTGRTVAINIDALLGFIGGTTRNPLYYLTLLSGALCILYLLRSETMSRPVYRFVYPSGVILIGTWTGVMAMQQFSGAQSGVYSIMKTILTGPGVYMVPVVIILLIVDIFYGWGRILGRAKSQAPRISEAQQ